jgi:hypothetical protein
LNPKLPPNIKQVNLRQVWILLFGFVVKVLVKVNFMGSKFDLSYDAQTMKLNLISARENAPSLYVSVGSNTQQISQQGVVLKVAAAVVHV